MRRPKCRCSKCIFDLHTQAGYGDLDDGQKAVHFEDRPYQTTLIEIAKRRNIIACLPTGSGKTYVALKLMEHYKNVIFEQSKKVFFLANTIPLVNQQAAFFARNSEFAVKHITGDMECDYWSKEKWEGIISGFNVIAMTAQIFLNIIRTRLIFFSSIQLIIFDECHHATNEHPMKNIMKEYQDVIKEKPDYPMPRILGLTATIIKGNCRVPEVPERVRELEGTMQSTAVTYKDYQEVLKCSTSARIDKKSVSFDSCSEWRMYIDELKEFSKQLNEFRKRRKKAMVKAEEAIKNGIHSTLTSADNIYLSDKTATPGDLKIAVDDVLATLEQLGTYCGLIALNLRLAFIEFSLMDLADGELKSWYLKIKQYFTRMRKEFQRQIQMAVEPLSLISPKLRCLVNLLRETFRDSQPPVDCQFDNDEGGACGLIFTDRRVTAQVLAWYLKDLAKKDDFKFVKANFVVGSSRSPFETVESRIYAKKQTDTINKFRNKDLNILVATSVLEEGLDVPSCNLVIRFDTIKSYTSYIQSMGRARKKNAIFYALLNSEKYLKESNDLDTFQQINKAMVNHLVRNVEKIDEEDNLSGYNIKGHNIEPFCPKGGPDSPRITLESASEIVDHYCMLLPCDGIATLNKLCWWEPVAGQRFRAHLRLPMNSVIRETISSEEVQDKDFAKLLVHFEAAKLLYKRHALDEFLIPKRPRFSDKLEAYFKFHIPVPTVDTDTEADNNENSGPISSKKPKFKDKSSSLKKDWYPKIDSVLFKGGQLQLGENYNVYRVCFEVVERKDAYPWKNLYNLTNSPFGFGLILSSRMPNVDDFPIHGGFGRITVSLRRIASYHIRWDIITQRKLLGFQRIVFGEILHLNHNLLSKQDDTSFAILPLVEESTGNWTLDENVLEEVHSFLSIEKTKRPNADYRKRAAFQERNLPSDVRRRKYDEKYYRKVVVPWYKGSKDKPMYLVDSIEHDMSPLSRQGFYNSFKQFYQREYKTEVFNLEQPLLKCKLAGVGKGPKQLNYLLEKYEKEDQFPVYLIPELCHMLPIPATYMTQLKFLPSILHRLNRLLLSCFCRMHRENRKKEEDLRLAREAKRQLQAEARRKFNMKDKPIPEKTRIEDRELHYEFIHPNEITLKHIRDFHTAVSDQHAAKKLTFKELVEEIDLEDGELIEESKIELLHFENLNLRVLEMANGDLIGPSMLAMMEGITRQRANDGVSNKRASLIGTAFMNFAVSLYVYRNFQDWNDPLMCQLRNRLLSTQYFNMVARKRNLARILAGSDFYPSESWVPPGFSIRSHIGEIAAANKVHLGVYNPVLDKIKDKSVEELENYVKFHAPGFQKPDEKATGTSGSTSKPKTRPLPPFIKFSAYTFAEINDMEIADALAGMAGIFFRDSGSLAAYKALKWLGFTVPDRNGNELNLDNNPEIVNEKIAPDEGAKKLVPTLTAFEEKIGYSFSNKTLFVEAVTHPSYLGNNITDCYQRIQFLGDAVLDLLITTHLHTLRSKHTIDELQVIRSALVNKVTYASLTVRYGLHKYLLSLSKSLTDMIDNFVVFQETVEHQVMGHFTLISDEECSGPKHVEVPKVLGDIFEALAGAIYIDSNGSLDTVWKIFYRLMQNEIDTFTATVPKFPLTELTDKLKDQVQFSKWTSDKLRSRGKEMIKISVGPYGQYFGVGTSYRRAREAAAKVALKMIKEDDIFMEGRDDKYELLLMV